MQDFINSLLHFIAEHAFLAYFIVFAIACSEALAFIGTFIPGSTLMVGVGAITATGALSLELTLLIAIIGAAVGDIISYWIGHHYQQDIKKMWPLRKYPKMFIRGEAFFERHGGKSILFGRFVGPVRAIVPVIAGMLRMPVGRFLLANILSGIGWALVHIIPGYLIGGSLIILGAVSMRLIILIFVLALLLWLTFWVFRKLFIWLERLSEKKGLLIPLLVLIFFLAIWLFLSVFEGLLHFELLVKADHSIYFFLQSIRSPLGDWFFIAVSELGDVFVNAFIAGVVLLILLLHRRWRAAIFWAIATGGGWGLILLFKWILQRPRPIVIHSEISSWGFPSGHTTMCIVIYGFLAILLTRSLKPRWRWLPLSIASGISLLMAFSRLYLGTHWFSGILGGLALGWTWITFLGIFYLHLPEKKMPKGWMLLGVLLTLLIVGSWHVSTHYAQDLKRYQTQVPIQEMSLDDWWNGGWQRLPAWRIDISGIRKAPLTFQWAGNPQQLSSQLIQKGWKRTIGIDYKRLLNLLVPNESIQHLPLLPKLENGHQEELLLSLTKGEKRLVVRLWPTEFKLTGSDQSFWVGTVEMEQAIHLSSLLTFPKNTHEYSEALQAFVEDLSEKNKKKFVYRYIEGYEKKMGDWTGRILLVEGR